MGKAHRLSSATRKAAIKELIEKKQLLVLKLHVVKMRPNVL
jgi:hypothetical protein